MPRSAAAWPDLVADFRVASPESRFTANFNRLGFHPGFGMSITLPRVVGVQKAALLFYTGRRIGGEEAHEIGLVDVLVPQAELRPRPWRWRRRSRSPHRWRSTSTRRTLRRGLADAIAGSPTTSWPNSSCISRRRISRRA